MVDAVELRPKTDRTNALRQRRYRRRRKRAAITPNVTAPISSVTPQPMPAVTPSPVTASRNGVVVDAAALVAATALASVSAFFAVTGMVAIYSAAAVPIMVMTAILEGSKLIATGWLAHRWRVAPALLRLALVLIVAVMMVLTAVGTFGFLTHAPRPRRRRASSR
jgi:hypothetical protein